MAKKKLRYFFVNEELHRVLKINRPMDLMIAWNYVQEKRVSFLWSDIRRTYGKAFTLTEVSKMIHRHRVILMNLIGEGKIRRPQQTYSLNGNRTPGKYLFSEKDVYDLHDYLLTVHIGRPRKDGKVTPAKMPSKTELRAMMIHDTTMYVKNSRGEFVPIWKEIDW